MLKSFYPIVGYSNSIQRIRKQIDFAAELNFPVFISGEVGCEKKEVAYSIHYNSQRRVEPFVSIPANLHNPGSSL
ncbi:sigma 54-interacting transcriptional regulator [Vibrio sp. PP-XX7]